MDISSDEGSESDFSDLEILEKKDKPLQQLRNRILKVKYPDGILRCPFGKGKKKKIFKYKDLHQHASGIKALVDKFNVSPIIFDLVEPIWSKFLASIEVFADDRAKEVIKESESQGNVMLDKDFVGI
ncbi:factor of DNA methylation 1-like protein [Tanacetum coccineum]